MIKLIKVIPMCGGHNKAFVVGRPAKRTLIFFCTNEGISTHPSIGDMNDCISHKGFADCLDIKAKAIPIANGLLKLDLPTYDKEYLENLIQSWK